MRKNLNHNILPEKQHTNPIKGNENSAEKQCIGQGRAGRRRRRPSPINETITQPSELSQKIPGAAEIETRITNHANSTAPVHSINNTNEGMTQRNPYPQMFPSIQVLHTGPHPNQLNYLHQKIMRVHNVQIVQKSQTLIWRSI